jgi:hypothetical protein
VRNEKYAQLVKKYAVSQNQLDLQLTPRFNDVRRSIRGVWGFG